VPRHSCSGGKATVSRVGLQGPLPYKKLSVSIGVVSSPEFRCRSPGNPPGPLQQPSPDPTPTSPGSPPPTPVSAAGDQSLRHVHQPRQGSLGPFQAREVEGSPLPGPAVRHQVQASRPRRIIPRVLPGSNLVLHTRTRVRPNQSDRVGFHGGIRAPDTRRRSRVNYTSIFGNAKHSSWCTGPEPPLPLSVRGGFAQFRRHWRLQVTDSAPAGPSALSPPARGSGPSPCGSSGVDRLGRAPNGTDRFQTPKSLGRQGQEDRGWFGVRRRA